MIEDVQKLIENYQHAVYNLYMKLTYMNGTSNEKYILFRLDQLEKEFTDKIQEIKDRYLVEKL